MHVCSLSASNLCFRVDPDQPEAVHVRYNAQELQSRDRGARAS
jgi:hypothetical protein